MTITLEHLVKNYGTSARAVDDVSFSIEPGEMFFLLGPSGCGKTTVLRMLAGFVRPDGGQILFDGKRMNEADAAERKTAMVFQNYAIWPHMTVYENVAYGPRARKLDATTIEKRVNESLRIVRLEELAQRKPTQLSGGQQQRVALARALAVDPNVILLDEPLSNLDTRLRLELREELGNIHRKTGTSCLYVTHDQEEALSLADRIAVMNLGRIEQMGTPAEIYQRPINEFVARFMGEINILSWDHPLVRQGESETASRLGFRPESVQLAESGVPGRVKRSVYLGSKTELIVELEQGPELKVWTRERLETGANVFLRVAPSDLIPL